MQTVILSQKTILVQGQMQWLQQIAQKYPVNNNKMQVETSHGAKIGAENIMKEKVIHQNSVKKSTKEIYFSQTVKDHNLSKKVKENKKGQW